MSRGLLPAARRPRGHRLRARPGARRDAPLRHPAVPAAQGRGPRGRVRERHPPGRRDRCATPGLGRDFTLDDLQNRGFDAVVIAIGCYDTNKLGIPNEDADGVIDGLDYLRTATLGLPYPGHEGTRVVVIGGGFTSMDCSRTSVRQGAREVTLVYRRDMKDMPAANEVHEAIEEGVQAIFQAGPVRVITDEKTGKVTGVEFIRMKLGEPDASGRRRPEPAPGHGVHDPLRPRAAGHRPGPGARLDRPRQRGRRRPTKQTRLKADAVTFETGRPGRVRHRRRPDRRRDGRPGHRRGPAGRVRGRRVPPGQRPVHASGPARRWPSRSPSSSRSCRSRPSSRSRATGSRRCEAEARNHNYIEYEIPYTRDEAVAESTRCLQCTCEAIGFCDLRRLGIEYGTTLRTLEPQYHQGAGYRSRDREPVHRATTTTTSATTPTRSSCASRRAASTAAAARTCAPRSWAPPATTSCASASTRW